MASITFKQLAVATECCLWVRAVYVLVLDSQPSCVHVTKPFTFDIGSKEMLFPANSLLAISADCQQVAHSAVKLIM